MEVPDGWLQLIRGPRPKSEKWPLKAPEKPAPAVRQTGGGQSQHPVPKKGKGKGQSKDGGPPVQSPAVPKPNLNPDEQLKAAQARVVKLEAAIVAIGDEDPAATGLKEALAKARVQAQLRPVQDRIAHTEAFLDRSRKKMEALSAEVSRIQEVMAELRAKIQDGVNRVGGSADRSQGTGEPIHRTNQSSGGDSFVESKDRTDGRFCGERHSGGCIKEIQDVCHISCRSGAQLCESTSIGGGFRANVRRRCRTMDAGSSGRHARSNSGRQPTRGGKVVPRHGHCSHKLVDSHCAAFHGVQRSPAMKMVPTWGCRGVRVGEASNPGPAVTRQSRRLERSTQIDVSSDEEQERV